MMHHAHACAHALRPIAAFARPHRRVFSVRLLHTTAPPQRAIKTAKTEAAGAPNGIGVVKVMGRYAGA
jgi:hypothetical protein